MTALLAGTGLEVFVAGRDVTRSVQRLTFSAVDPGGYETCSADIPATDTPVRKGDPVAIFDGIGEVWWGRVEEPGAHTQGGRTTYSVQAVGAGAALKDAPYACVYVDRDLSGWRDTTTAERVRILGANWTVGQFATSQDQTNGLPGLSLSHQGPWPTAVESQAWYDAGALCRLAALYVDWINIAGSGGTLAAYGCDQDTLTSADTTTIDAALSAAETGTTTVPILRRRYAVLDFYSVGAYAGSSTEEVHLRNIAVYGDHGLTLRGPAPSGFYPSDIARHALKQAKGVLPGAIQNATSYIVSHSVYKEPTTPETVIDDMAKLMGWHWGVWGPSNVLDDQPRLHFRPPPSEATAACSRLQAEDFQLSDQLSSTYDSVVVAWQDAAGTRGYETVTQANATLPDRVHRTGQVDIGTSTRAGAQAFGRTWLLLTQRAQRSGGQCTLPATVLTPTGAARRSLTLKPGLDRLRFTDIPSDGQNLLEADTRRFDTFRLKRVETSIEQGGIPRTRAEFDTGADLISTLQSRLDAATKLATG